jgi:hypothetical protein
MSVVSHRPASPKSKGAAGTVKCRWIRKIGEVDTNIGLLEINGKLYGVAVVEGGYRLVKPDGSDYAVNAEDWLCDCPDFVYRRANSDPEGCKPVKALRAAFASVPQS